MNRGFRDLTIASKLWLIIGASLLGLLAAAAYSFVQLERNLLSDQKARAQSVVESAFGVLEHFGDEAASGRISAIEAQRAALRMLRRLRYGTDGYLWVNDMVPRLLMDPFKPELVGQNLSELTDPRGDHIYLAVTEVVRSEGAGFVEYMWPRPFGDRPIRKVSFVKGFPRWGWVLGSGVYLDDVEAAAAAEARRMLSAAAALAVLLCLATALLARSVSRGLRRAVDVAHRLAHGDLTVQLKETTADEPGQLLAAMKEMIERHSRVLAEVRCAAGALSASSDRVSAIARSVLQGSRDQAASTAQSAVSMQRMSASIEANRDVARATDRLTARAVREATEGREAVLEAAAAVQQISEKILVIHEIAHQTTLLAHDFSIQETRVGAARASAEAAEHVRQLYEQTRSAAQEIGMLAGSSAALVSKACRLLEAIVPSIEKASRQAQAVSAAADEATSHAKGITEVEARLEAISRGHATAAEKLSAEAADVRRHAQELQDLVAFFTLDGAADRLERAAVPAQAAVAGAPSSTPQTKPS